MKNIRKGKKSVAAIAMAAMMIGSVSVTAASASAYTVSALSSYSTSTSTYTIPPQVYMTQYISSAEKRYAKASAVTSAAASLLSNVNYTDLGLGFGPSFSGVTLSVGSTKYDYLIKANAENGATVLTFNSLNNLKSGMSKIKTEEQTIMNNALAPYISYIDSLISAGTYSKVNQGDTDTVKAVKISNAALLSAAKSALTYTYSDTDLFSGDVTGSSKTYQIAYLSTASVGDSTTQSVVSNDEEFTDFPKLILNGATVDWSSVHHLSLFGNSNDSWWFALKDGNTLNNDYYWLNGMMIPDFVDTISFDAYAGTYWAQYGAANTSNSSSDSSSTGYVTSAGYYYNPSYNYVSDYVYSVTQGTQTWYYPNYKYAEAAVANGTGSITSAAPSTHTSTARYFCFWDGKYYTSADSSTIPSYTAYMSTSSSLISYTINGNYVYNASGEVVGSLTDRGYSLNATWFSTDTGRFYSTAQSNLNGYWYGSSASNTQYYVHNGNVYDTSGSNVGTTASRGYTTASTWFNATDGYFYTTPQTNSSGYYVSSSNVNSVDLSDPYYLYWYTMLSRQSNKNNDSSSNATSKTEEAKNTNDKKQTTKTEVITVSDSADSYVVTGTELAAARASGNSISVSPLKYCKWTVSGNDVTTASDISFRTIFSVKNIPDALKNEVKKNTAASSTFTVGENVAWGSRATLTINYAPKRANYIAKLYRYDTGTGMLALVNTSTVGNDGSVSFGNINHGGDYIVTLQ